MKIRSGFVSNSSSTAFVLVTIKEEHEKALAKLTELQKKFVLTKLEFNILNMGLVGYTYFSGEEPEWEEWAEENGIQLTDDESDELSDALCAYGNHFNDLPADKAWAVEYNC